MNINLYDPKIPPIQSDSMYSWLPELEHLILFSR